MDRGSSTGRIVAREAPPHSCGGDAELRCGWCGLAPSEEDRLLVCDHHLCSSCFDILRDVDWLALLAEGAGRVDGGENGGVCG